MRAALPPEQQATQPGTRLRGIGVVPEELDPDGDAPVPWHIPRGGAGQGTEAEPAAPPLDARSLSKAVREQALSAEDDGDRVWQK